MGMGKIGKIGNIGKINVLYVIRPAVGGMKAHLLYLVRYIDKKRFNIAIACPPNFICRELLDAGVEIFPISIKGEISPQKDFSAIKALTKILSKKKITIMHAHGFKAGLIGRLAAILAKTPVVYYTVHNSLFHGGLPSWQRRVGINVEKWLAGFTDRIITVSNALRTELTKCGKIEKNKIITIYNGIDFEKFSNTSFDAGMVETKLMMKKKFGLNFGRPLVGTVARLVNEKGIKYLLEAAASLKRNVNLLIVGDGPQRWELQEAAKNLGLDNTVAFVGRQANILPVLQAVDIFVLPSTCEGMGMVILEAMAAGKPVVASRVGGIPEIITNGETGLLVEPKSPVLLTAAIKELLDNSKKARLLGKKGKEMVAEKFCAQTMVKKIYNLYQKDFISFSVEDGNKKLRHL